MQNLDFKKSIFNTHTHIEELCVLNQLYTNISPKPSLQFAKTLI